MQNESTNKTNKHNLIHNNIEQKSEHRSKKLYNNNNDNLTNNASFG